MSYGESQGIFNGSRTDIDRLHKILENDHFNTSPRLLALLILARLKVDCEDYTINQFLSMSFVKDKDMFKIQQRHNDLIGKVWNNNLYYKDGPDKTSVNSLRIIAINTQFPSDLRVYSLMLLIMRDRMEFEEVERILMTLSIIKVKSIEKLYQQLLEAGLNLNNC